MIRETILHNEVTSIRFSAFSASNLVDMLLMVVGGWGFSRPNKLVLINYQVDPDHGIRFSASNFLHFGQATFTLLNAYWYGCNTLEMEPPIANNEDENRTNRIAVS